MHKILHSYKLRLTNLNQGNRSLRLQRLSSRRDIDWKDLGFLHKASAEEMLHRLIAGRDIPLIQRIDPRHAPTNQADRRLNRIYRTAENLLEEAGSYDLFVGYPFVEGAFLDGTKVRGPLLLFPVRLERNLQDRPRWKLKVLDDEPVSFNRTLFLAYERYQQQRLPESFWEAEAAPNRNWQDWMQALYQQLKPYELDINFTSRLFEPELQSFPDLLKASMDSWQPGILSCRPQAVLGLFPQSDSALMQDYEALESRPDAFRLEELLKPPQEQGAAPENSYIKEEARFFVTEVDQTQEDALLQVKQGRSIVLHGPPGTGKSQVIVNIIADAMAHGKRVLLVSQKRAALDVVYQRLQALKLGRFAVLIHDHRHDRRPMYDRIRRQIEGIEEFQAELKDLDLTRKDHAFKVLSRQLDQTGRQFEDLHQALSHPLACGLTVHELYLRTDAAMPRIPLDNLPQNLSQGELNVWLEKVEQVADYGEFFDPRHPWYHRRSLAGFDFAREASLKKLVAGLEAEMTDLHDQFTTLSETLNTRILDLPLNRERIAAFREIDKGVQDHGLREVAGYIQDDPATAELLGLSLNEWEAAVLKLDKRSLLDDTDWGKFAVVAKHAKVYKRMVGNPLRYLSIPFQRARWYLRKLTEARVEWTPELHQHIKREIVWYQKLHKLYVREHDRDFFADFPLLNSQQEKKEWIAQRRASLELFTRIKEITYFRRIKPRFEFDVFDLAHWMKSMQHIDALEEFTRQLDQTHESWLPWLHPSQIETLWPGIRSTKAVKPVIQALKQQLDKDFSDLRDLDRLLQQWRPIERSVLPMLADYFLKPKKRSVLLPRLRNSVYRAWIEQAEQHTPVLAEVSSRGWGRSRKNYQDKVDQRRADITELIQARVKERIIEAIEYNRLNNPVTYREIHHQVRKKRLIWPVRRLIRETWNEGLSTLMPVWMASPESVAAMFPMQADFFDVVIFDEASQCFVERGLPAILRGKQAVIAGDEQQLQPLSLYQVRVEEDEERMDAYEALEVESILDLARQRFASCYLRWHYRSAEASLIQFSNQHFYENRLFVLPPAHPDGQYQPPLEWVSVEGSWEQNRNTEEAERVVDLICSWVNQPNPPSIGVVTFNFHQQECIKDCLDARLELLVEQDRKAYHRLFAAMHKVEEEAFEGIFVKNIENVQGDERDIIIFSVGYAPNEKGQVAARFGLLNQSGGENRLNVAISRARQKIYLVCSFAPQVLRTESSAHPGPRLFKAYLQYARRVSDVGGISVEAQPPADPVDRVMHRYLRTGLEKAGYHVETELGEAAYRMDLAVKQQADDPAYLMGIMIEGPHYFSGASSKEREVYRPMLWQARGWELMQVWARSFWLDREKVLAAILKRLGKKALKAK